MNRRRIALIAILAFIAALVGVLVGRQFLAPPPQPGAELHAVLHEPITAEHGNGPRVAAAVDASHRTMGELQKETLAHIFAMRALLRPDQAAKFDAAVTKALTEDAQ